MSTLSANSNASLPNLMFIFLLNFGFTLKLLGTSPNCAPVLIKGFSCLSNIDKHKKRAPIFRPRGGLNHTYGGVLHLLALFFGYF